MGSVPSTYLITNYMISAGIDIGSRTIKLVILSENIITFEQVVDNSFNTMEICNKLLDGKNYDKITSTGYGRHLFADYYECDVISEIKAFSLGIRSVFPNVRTILDIGGQDTKAISLDEQGKVKKFEMNDKCAAGTGRFLEIMAMALRYNLDQFSTAALSVNEKESISSMCTVFAESEVVSMIGKGYDRNKISRGIHFSIINRAINMLKKVNIEDDIAFVGGVANNIAIKVLLSEILGKKIYVPNNPQTIGAIGCAIYN
ncbi:MAG TPA: acyl-CoA dehydratase activase [Bacteroidales bacterium]|nr:acyl-CoA dehydratase activase [Bacteroidales bacterium]